MRAGHRLIHTTSERTSSATPTGGPEVDLQNLKIQCIVGDQPRLADGDTQEATEKIAAQCMVLPCA